MLCRFRAVGLATRWAERLLDRGKDHFPGIHLPQDRLGSKFFEPINVVGIFVEHVAAGDRDDPGIGIELFEQLDHLAAFQVRHEDVDDGQIRTALFVDFDTLDPTLGFNDRVATAFEHPAEDTAKERVVDDEQYNRHGSLPPGLATTACSPQAANRHTIRATIAEGVFERHPGICRARKISTSVTATDCTSAIALPSPECQRRRSAGSRRSEADPTEI